ncbi:uncharacterized protein PFLUO_LOCUS2578 [Penicillium psychrofluorescens]|uniref:uncharacterized protein n=1 Tax=Penicillium psychrofluorescens TaxID=3158075 RepID=UPI003CCD4A64
MSTKRTAFKVHGTVQGVGFRDFVQKSAINLGLHGYVEGEAQGSGETVQTFLQQINKGPRMAHVDKLEKMEMEPREDEDRFQVLNTSKSLFGSEC